MSSALACLVFVAILVTCIPKDWSYLDMKEEQTEEKETVLIVCCYYYRKGSVLSIELGSY